MPPHVYAVADRAFRSMKADKKSQSVLISGESGAGKTETAKLVMQYLVKVGAKQGGQAAVNEQRILDSNPILEAFGNAKTLRNNNSSRFGKFIEIQFNDQSNVVGASIVTYLLEKSRLVFQAKGERNYHVFYQLLAGADAGMRTRYHLGAPETFRLVNQSGCISINGLSDAEEFRTVIKALRDVGTTDAELDGVFRTVAGILHLGNAEFQATGRTTDQATLTNEASCKHAAELLGLNTEYFFKKLVSRVVSAGPGGGGGKSGDKIEVPLKLQEAVYYRDALVKAIYSRLFDWLVFKINDSFRSDEPCSTFIGILDIFGFEFFENNSFEQFCINYANEKLQQHFNEHLFISERKIYELEGIKVPEITYTDNQDCIDLVEKRPTGIIPMLDEECRLPKTTDLTFGAKVFRVHGNHPRLDAPRVGGGRGARNFSKEEAFVIKHYAASVCYQTAGFLDKNNDSLHADLAAMMKASTVPLVAQIFSDELDARKARFGTIANTFSRQLQDLVANLNQTVCHFIRCIKPNEAQAKGIFQGGMILSQLRCNGMLDVLQLMHAGYPTRCPYSDLYDRFRTMLPPEISRMDPPHFCEALLMALECDPKDFALGLTLLFFRSGRLAFLEDLRGSGTQLPPNIVEKVRRWIARKRFRRAIWFVVAGNKVVRRLHILRALCHFKHAQAIARFMVQPFRLARKVKFVRYVITIQRVVRGFLAARHFRRLRRAAITFQRFERGRAVRKETKPLLEEARRERSRMASELKAQEEERLREQRREAQEKKQREAARKQREAEIQRQADEQRKQLEEERAREEADRLRQEAEERQRFQAMVAQQEAMLAASRSDESRLLMEQMAREKERRDEELQALQRQLSQASSVPSQEVDSLRDQLRDANLKIEEMQSTAQLQKRELDSMKAKYNEAKEARAEWQKRCEESQARLAKANETHSLEQAKMAAQLAALRDAETVAQRRREESESIGRDEVDAVVAQRDALRADKAALLEKIATLESQVQEAVDNKEDAERQHKLALAKLKIDSDRTAKKLAQAGERALKAEKALKEVEVWRNRVLEQLSTASSAEKKEKERLRAQVASLTSIINDLKRAGGVTAGPGAESSAGMLASMDAVLANIQEGTASASASLQSLAAIVKESAADGAALESELIASMEKQGEAELAQRTQLRETIVARLTDENASLVAKSKELIARVVDLEEKLADVQSKAVSAATLPLEGQVSILRQENETLYEVKDALAQRVETLEQEKAVDRKIKQELIQKMREEEAKEIEEKSRLTRHMLSLRAKTAELEEKRDEKMRATAELISTSDQQLAMRVMEIARLAEKNAALAARNAELEQRIASGTGGAGAAAGLIPMPMTSGVPEDKQSQFLGKQRRVILDLWSDLQQTTLEKMNRAHNNLVGFAELVFLSNKRIDEIVDEARKLSGAGQVTGENKELLDLLLEQAKLRKTLNDYSEEILRQTLDKIGDDDDDGEIQPYRQRSLSTSSRTSTSSASQAPVAAQPVQQQGGGLGGMFRFGRRAPK
eukprot:TRINITY_DN7311_c0_g1_i3.p1 TRINITY_DN7311_c0_g1~~TRINITY_DN7311_c0_g1_i3.p1  ORF type:complete len:1642 (-),score=466.43 TRINITY_DN7311_c0_g1_i3:61-4626(-)